MADTASGVMVGVCVGVVGEEVLMWGHAGTVKVGMARMPEAQAIHVLGLLVMRSMWSYSRSRGVGWVL